MENVSVWLMLFTSEENMYVTAQYWKVMIYSKLVGLLKDLFPTVWQVSHTTLKQLKWH